MKGGCVLLIYLLSGIQDTPQELPGLLDAQLAPNVLQLIEGRQCLLGLLARRLQDDPRLEHAKFQRSDGFAIGNTGVETRYEGVEVFLQASQLDAIWHI